MNVTQRGSARGGFTLVEMLVAVALVLLMMTMFGSIFQMASSSITTQRGIANNDQKARSFTTMLRADLDKRTFRNVIPYFYNEDANTSPNPFSDRQGYLYVSVNDPANGVDDVLQLTVGATIIRENNDESPYYGKATQLFGPGGPADEDGDGDIDAVDAYVSLVNSPNQPEADDERVEPNSTGTSPYAEVSYFIRGGNLYRRVLLIREPLELAGRETQAQPELTPAPAPPAIPNYFDFDDDVTTGFYFTGAGGPAPNFWNDFDYSAFRTFDAAGAPTSAAKFHGVESLNNEAEGSTFFSLGKPQYRWGHSTTLGPAPAQLAFFGCPREFTLLPGGPIPSAFLGRFLHEETSFFNAANRFGYPQENTIPRAGASASGNPMDIIGTPLTLNGREVVEQYTDALGNGGPRRAEELLLAHVHEFAVELWDDRLQKFVTPGHGQANPATGQLGDYAALRRLNNAYGPLGPVNSGVMPAHDRPNRVFDTWHPGTTDLTAATPVLVGDSSQPPFRPMTFYPPRTTDTPAGPSPATMPGPFASNSGPTAYWQPGVAYSVGDVVFPFTEDLNQNSILDVGEDNQLGEGANMLLDSHAPSRPFGFTYHYRCVQAGTSRVINTPGEHQTNAPSWQTREGALISEDTDGDGISGEVGEPIWIAVPNVRPARAIRIRIRFLDPGTEQMRQVSITHSLMN